MLFDYSSCRCNNSPEFLTFGWGLSKHAENLTSLLACQATRTISGLATMLNFFMVKYQSDIAIRKCNSKNAENLKRIQHIVWYRLTM